jgi:hypothetical protein
VGEGELVVGQPSVFVAEQDAAEGGVRLQVGGVQFQAAREVPQREARLAGEQVQFTV